MATQSPWDTLINGLPKLSFPGIRPTTGQGHQADANGYIPSEEEDAALQHLASQTLQPYRPGWAALPGVASSIVGGMAVRQLRDNARLRSGADRAAMANFMGGMSVPQAPVSGGATTAPAAPAPQPAPARPMAPPLFASAPEDRPAIMGGSTAVTPAPQPVGPSPSGSGLPDVAGTSVGTPPPMTAPTLTPQSAPAPQAPIRINRQVEEINRQLGAINGRIQQVQQAYASAGTDRARQFFTHQLSTLQSQAQALNSHLITVADPMRDVQMQTAEMELAAKRREMEHPSGKITELDPNKRLMYTDPRTGETRVIMDATGGSNGPFKDAKQKADVEEGLRKEYAALAKPYFETRDAWTRIQQSASKPSAAGDVALIFNFMKMLDPGSVVREGEFATAQNAAGVPERISALYNRVLSGERLTDGIRSDFVGQAKGLYDRAAAQYQGIQSQYRGISTRTGADPQNTIVDFGPPGAASVQAPPAARSFDDVGQIPEGAKFKDQQTGAVYMKRGGQIVPVQ